MTESDDHDGGAHDAGTDADPGVGPEETGPSNLSPRIEKLHTLPLTERRVAMRRLAAAGRDVIELMSSTAAETSELDEASARLEEVVGILQRYPSGSGYEGVAEMANAGDLWAERQQMIEDGDAEAFAAFDYSPFIGLANPMSPPILMDYEGERVVARVTFGAAYEGPPACVHGGYVAAAFDELLGATQSLSGAQGMTARLTVNFRSPTPLNEELTLEGWLERREGRKIWVVGKMMAGDLLTAEAEGLFIAFDSEGFRALLETRMTMQARSTQPPSK